MNENEFKCELCKKIFIQENTEEQVSLEAKLIEPDLDEKITVELCEECYKIITKYLSQRN